MLTPPPPPFSLFIQSGIRYMKLELSVSWSRLDDSVLEGYFMQIAVDSENYKDPFKFYLEKKEFPIIFSQQK